MTLEFVDAIDVGIDKLFQIYTGMDTSSWSVFTRERICLSIKLKGCGLRGAGDRRSAQYIGAAVWSIMPLLDRRDGRGSLTPGHLPAVVTLFGTDSFTHPYTAPWRGVLNNSRPVGNIANGLLLTWSQLTTNFQAVVSDEQILAGTRLLLK